MNLSWIKISPGLRIEQLLLYWLFPQHPQFEQSIENINKEQKWKKRRNTAPHVLPRSLSKFLSKLCPVEKSDPLEIDNVEL